MGVGWREWPERLRAGRLDAGDYDVRVAARHVYAQWSMDRQLAGAVAGGWRRGVSTCTSTCRSDRPATASTRGSTATPTHGGPRSARHPTTSSPPARTGASRRCGPTSGRDEGHRHLAECLRHHMTHAGMLRLDHVMGLHRLFWVPDGMDATTASTCATRPTSSSRWWPSSRSGPAASWWARTWAPCPTRFAIAMDRHRVLRSYVAEFSMPGAPGDAVGQPDHRMVASRRHPRHADLRRVRRRRRTSSRRDEGRPLGGRGRARPGRAAARPATRLVGTAAASCGRLAPGDGGHGAVAAAGAARAARRQRRRRRCSSGSTTSWARPSRRTCPAPGPSGPTGCCACRRPLTELAADPAVGACSTAVQARRLASHGAGRLDERREAPPGRSGYASSMQLGRTCSTDDDLWLFNEGAHTRLYDRLGAQLRAGRGARRGVGARTRPRCRSIGDFNGWRPGADPLEPQGGVRDLAGVRRACSPRRPLQVPHRLGRPRLLGRQGRSVRVPGRAAAAHGVGGLGPDLRVARRGVDGAARRGRTPSTPR